MCFNRACRVDSARTWRRGISPWRSRSLGLACPRRICCRALASRRRCAQWGLSWFCWDGPRVSLDRVGTWVGAWGVGWGVGSFSRGPSSSVHVRSPPPFRKDGDREARLMRFADKTSTEASRLRRAFPERVHIVPVEGLTEWATAFFQDLHYRVLLRPRRRKAPPAYDPNLARNAGSREQGLRK